MSCDKCKLIETFYETIELIKEYKRDADMAREALIESNDMYNDLKREVERLKDQRIDAAVRLYKEVQSEEP